MTSFSAHGLHRIVIFRESEQFESTEIVFIEEMYVDHGNSEEPLLGFGETEIIHS